MKSIRTMILGLAMACSCLAVHAQGIRSVNISAGLLYRNTADATLSYEIESKYHNAWELFATGAARWKYCPDCSHGCADSFWKDHPTWGIGAAYKPCVYRRRNVLGRMRVGASFGSNTDKFLAGLHLGYEHNYALRGGWRLFWQVKGDCLIRKNDLLRVGGAVGVAIPCYPK